jgi:hypothetical protein
LNECELEDRERIAEAVHTPNGWCAIASRGYDPTREAAMAAFAKSWRREGPGYGKLTWKSKSL